MSVALGVAVAGERTERLVADLLVAPFFAGERPLRGAAGRVDWRLCGLLSEQLLAGGLTGAPGGVLLVPSGGRLKCPRVLLLGLGPRTGFAEPELEGAVRDAVGRAAGLRAGRTAVALPEERRSGLATSAAAAAVLSGAAQALAETSFPLHLLIGVEPDAVGAARAGIEERARASLPAGVRVRLAGESERFRGRAAAAAALGSRGAAGPLAPVSKPRELP